MKASKEITVYRKDWHDCTRYILATEGGSAQLDVRGSHRFEDIIPEPIAYFWDLWVEESNRRQGIATALIEKAEQIAKEESFSQIVLEWEEENTPLEIFKWYERRGYDERMFGNGYSFMVKQLTPTTDENETLDSTRHRR